MSDSPPKAESKKDEKKDGKKEVGLLDMDLDDLLQVVRKGKKSNTIFKNAQKKPFSHSSGVKLPRNKARLTPANALANPTVKNSVLPKAKGSYLRNSFSLPKKKVESFNKGGFRLKKSGAFNWIKHPSEPFKIDDDEVSDGDEAENKGNATRGIPTVPTEVKRGDVSKPPSPLKVGGDSDDDGTPPLSNSPPSASSQLGSQQTESQTRTLPLSTPPRPGKSPTISQISAGETLATLSKKATPAAKKATPAAKSASSSAKSTPAASAQNSDNESIRYASSDEDLRDDPASDDNQDRGEEEKLTPDVSEHEDAKAIETFISSLDKSTLTKGIVPSEPEAWDSVVSKLNMKTEGKIDRSDNHTLYVVVKADKKTGKEVFQVKDKNSLAGTLGNFGFKGDALQSLYNSHLENANYYQRVELPPPTDNHSYSTHIIPVYVNEHRGKPRSERNIQKYIKQVVNE